MYSHARAFLASDEGRAGKAARAPVVAFLSPRKPDKKKRPQLLNQKYFERFFSGTRIASRKRIIE